MMLFMCIFFLQGFINVHLTKDTDSMQEHAAQISLSENIVKQCL